MHIARTRDWRTGTTRAPCSTRPTGRPGPPPTSGLWAPDIRYVAGRYVLYFTVTDTTLNAGDDSAIGVATAPDPVGPVDTVRRAGGRPRGRPPAAGSCGPSTRPGSPTSTASLPLLRLATTAVCG